MSGFQFSLSADSLMDPTGHTAVEHSRSASPSAPNASEAVLEVPVKFILLRRGSVVERRRSRLINPTFEDVKRCARQWACGAFRVQYTDDDGDLVTVDLDEEWAECVCLWCQQTPAGHPRPALSLWVELSPASPVSAPPSAPQHPAWGWWGGWRGHRHRHHHHHPHGAWAPPPCPERDAGAAAAPGQEGPPCCRRSVFHPGKHAPWCHSAAAGEGGWRGCGWPSRASRGSGEEGGEGGDALRRCAAEGCGYSVTGLHPTHCCKRCAKQGGSHGPRCQHTPAGGAGSDVEEHPQQQQDTAPAPAARCAFEVSDPKRTHCCKKCSKTSGQHGKKCAQRLPEEAIPRAAAAEEEEEGVPEAAAAVEAEAQPPAPQGVPAECPEVVGAVEAAVPPAPQESREVPAPEVVSDTVEAVVPEPRVTEGVVVQEGGVALLVPETDAERCITGMGFELTYPMRELLKKHGGSILLALEELL